MTSQLIYLDQLAKKTDAVWYYEHEHPHPIVSTAEIDGALAEKLDWEHVFGLIMERVKAFVAEHAHGKTIHLFESCFYQIVAGYLFRMNCPRETIRSCMRQLEQALAPLRACLIYFYQDDIEAALERICHRRGDEFDQYLLKRFEGTPYGEAHSVSDFPSLVAAYVDFRRIADELAAESTFEICSIDTSDADWPAVMNQVTGFLGIDDYQGPPSAIRDLSEYAGRYTEVSSGHEWTLSVENGELVFDEFKTRLHPFMDDGFLIEGVTVELHFEADESNRITGIRIGGNVIGDPIVDTRWKKAQ